MWKNTEDLDWPMLSYTDSLLAARTRTGLDMLALWYEPPYTKLYRAVVLDATRVQITPMATIDVSPVTVYIIGTEPMWITERLAALLIMPLPPPQREVPGVGMRVSEYVFWIEAP